MSIKTEKPRNYVLALILCVMHSNKTLKIVNQKAPLTLAAA